MSELRPSGRANRRSALLDAMAGHLLAHGFAGSPLRALATAAGTSDRMLLYYFTDRDELLEALLDHIAARLHDRLDSIDLAPQRWAALLDLLWTQTRTPELRPYLQLFLDLATAAGRGEEPHRSAAARIGDGFVTWVAARLDPAEGPPRARAALLLATLDGLFLLDSAGLVEDAAGALQIATAGR